MMIRDTAMNIFDAALSAVDPYQCVLRSVRLEKGSLVTAGTLYDLDTADRLIVVGAGKASARMATALEDVLGNRIERGLVIVPYGQTPKPGVIGIAEASHPLPDEAGVLATGQVLDLARKATEKSIVLCLLSGGGSALLVAPVPAITLEDKRKTTELLLKSGCTIAELNAVRKHLSEVKGGGLAKAAYPASIVSLILSDVVGDTIDVICSGPTAPDGSTFADVSRILEKYRLKQDLPARVAAYLERGVAGQEQETAKNSDSCFTKARKVIVAGIDQALFAARNSAKSIGYNAVLVTSQVQGLARDVGRLLAQTAMSIRAELKPGERRCLLYGGETTVAVSGTGKGGRNQELALAFAREIAGIPGIAMLSASTDGIDGPTDAAGAFVDGFIIQKARDLSMNPDLYLGNNDSYTFFRKIDYAHKTKYHVLTGPTGTNVMDLQIILLEG